MKWDAKLYDTNHQFVSKYGRGLIELLRPTKNENILDLGCGTGDLTAEMTETGAQVTGIDPAAEMIEKAQDKYPDIRFVQADATDFKGTQKYDAVFSNAVLHWIKTPEKALRCINSALRKEGRFVAEMGGKGNVQIIRDTIREVLLTRGFKEQAAIQKWYFPSVAEYAGLLEKYGFEIRQIGTYDRPTVLTDTENGIMKWLTMFAGAFFEDIPELEKGKLLEEMQNSLREKLYRNEEWVADYKRLRFYAVKIG